MVGQMS
jgi:hypothetical protein